ncbi:hypothetical protein AB0F88_16775 [Streptosporangium sp. NPDC023963]|uniref:hypothetical protein n=1 Tax=Streptosporangium sp. NPDC023963 TaxID=3155608 RepID=UPI003446B623
MLIAEPVPWEGTIARCNLVGRDQVCIVHATSNRPDGLPAELRDDNGEPIGVADEVWIDDQHLMRARGRLDAATDAGRDAAARLVSARHVAVHLGDAHTRRLREAGSDVLDIVLLTGWRVEAVQLVRADQAPWDEAVITAAPA